MKATSTRSYWWVLLVSTVGLCVLLYAVLNLQSGGGIKSVLIFVILGLFAEFLEVPLPSGSTASQGSIVFVAATLSLQWTSAVLVAAISVLGPVLYHRQAPRRAVYNIAQISISVLCSSVAFHLLSGKLSSLIVAPRWLFAALLAWAVHFTANVSLISMAVALDEDRPFGSSFRDILRRSSPAAPLQGALGIGLAILFGVEQWVGLGLFSVALVFGYLALTANFFKARNIELSEQYADSQVYLNELMASMMNAVVGIDTSLRVNIFNRGAEQIFGCSASSILGQHVVEISEVTLPTLLSSCLKTGGSISDRELCLKTTEKAVDVLCNVTIMKNSHGEVTGSVAVLQDITERKRMEQRLNHMDRLSLLGEFAAGIVHEINNPLMLIQMAMDNVEHDLRDRGLSDEVEQLQMGSRNLNRLEKLAKQLLAFSRPRPSEPRPIDVGEVLDDVLNLATVQARVAKVRLERQVSRGVSLLAEAASLQQVFLNLIMNAIQAMPGGGELSVELGEERRSVRQIAEGGVGRADVPRIVRDMGPVALPQDLERELVWVRFVDTGSGIPGEILERLGQSFITTKESGTGLGMAMVSKVIAQYQGVLEMTSEPGDGTSVTVWLPRLMAQDLVSTDNAPLLAADARLAFQLTPPVDLPAGHLQEAATTRE